MKPSLKPSLKPLVPLKPLVNVDYTIPVPVLGKLAEKLVLKRNERESDMNAQNIKEQMEG